MPTFEKIAIILPNWIGDVVMATPALRALRRRFADSRITFIGKSIALETLAGLGLCDSRITDPSRTESLPAGLAKLISLLRAERFDFAILLPNSFRSAIVARLAGIERLAGYSRDGRGWLLTDKLPPPRDENGRFRPISAIDYYNNLANILGAKCDSSRMTLVVGDSDARAADDMLRDAGADSARPIIMLNPGAAFGVSKMWDPHKYAALADLLIEKRDAQIIINAAPNERKIAADVARYMSGRPLINFAERNNTIGLLKALLKKSDLLITNDTGARHLAAGLSIAVVTLFGSTDPQWAEINFSRERTIRVDLPCSPCQKKVCPQAAGPLYHKCMAAITPEMVLPAALELLDTCGETENEK